MVVLHPDADTRVPGITAETVKEVDSVGDVAEDSEGDLLVEDSAVDDFRDIRALN